MTDALIVSTARTGLAKSWRGALNMTHGATIGGHVVKHAIQRAGIEAGESEGGLMGCAPPQGATGAQGARPIALRGRRPRPPPRGPGDRLLCCRLQTIALASQRT